MEILDYSKEYIVPSCRPHSPIFPKNIFAIIAGSTGGGKTNLLINLLRKAKLLNYDHLYIYSSTLHQPAYEYLRQFYLDLEKLIYDKKKNSKDSPIL
jgi:ABC-type lipoprotein export system ATPase subunit